MRKGKEEERSPKVDGTKSKGWAGTRAEKDLQPAPREDGSRVASASSAKGTRAWWRGRCLTLAVHAHCVKQAGSPKLGTK